MKKTFSFLLLLFISAVSQSQIYRGAWSGEAIGPDTTLTIKMNVMRQIDTFIGVIMFKPFPELLSDSAFTDSCIHLKGFKTNMELKGKLSEDQTRMTGELIHDEKFFKIDLTRDEKPIKRTQTPKRPYPYLSEDIVFRNKKDSIELAATLTLPDSTGKFPAVVLISGSQPHERRIDALHHNMFLVVSDYLTRNGIAVLHSDSRGTEGLGKKFFQSTAKDIAGDVNAAVEYLMNRKEIDKTKIGLIGHSEGGLVAAITAAENKNISFVVMLAGMAINGKENFMLQHELRYRHGDISWESYEFLEKLNELAFSLYPSHTDAKIIRD
jgi:hypothetical protein